MPTNTLALSEVIAVTHLVYISSLLSFQATDKYKAQTITSSLPKGRPCITRLTSGKSSIHMGLEIFLLCTKQIHSWMIVKWKPEFPTWIFYWLPCSLEMCFYGGRREWTLAECLLCARPCAWHTNISHLVLAKEALLTSFRRWNMGRER